MNNLQKTIEELTINFLTKNNCKIEKTKNGYDINHINSNLDFVKNIVQIHFDDTKKIKNHELIAPGNQLLHKILTSSLNYGPILFGKWKKNHMNPHIRFNFYILFESVSSENFLDTVDIDLQTLEISQVDEELVDYSENFDPSLDIKNSDDAYIEAIDFLEKKIYPDLTKFKDKISKLKENEINDVKQDYNYKIKQTEEKASNLRSVGKFGKKFDELMEKNKILKEEKNALVIRINEKYSILIDIALTSAQVIY
jgi:hypothetical protein